MVTTTENEFIANRREGHARWLVELNDGTLCYQDDGREDTEISGWVRLGNFCRLNKLHIVGLYLQFRRETVALPQNKEGYYFCNSALSWMNSNITFHYFVVGYLEDNQIYTRKYKIPELILEEEEIRKVKMDDLCLIVKERGHNVN